jgi:hypothetical protein
VSHFAGKEGGDLLDQISKTSSAFGAKHGGKFAQDEKEGAPDDEWD